MEPTWATRDLPVLDAAVQYLDEHSATDGLGPEGGELMQMTGLSEDEVVRAVYALEGDYVRVERTLGPPINAMISGVTVLARQAVGQWPTPESLADRLVAALADAAERELDEERRGWLRKTAAYLGGVGRDLAVEVTAAVVARSVGAG